MRVCVFVCTQGELDKQKQYNDAVNAPSVRNAVSASVCEGKYCHMVFSSLTRLSSHVAHADMTISGCKEIVHSNSIMILRENNELLLCTIKIGNDLSSDLTRVCIIIGK